MSESPAPYTASSGDPIQVVLSRLKDVKQGGPDKWVAYCPESSDHMTFETTTVVNQVVLVDNHGDYLSTVADCSQIVSGPDRDNLWHCSECGEKAKWRQE